MNEQSQLELFKSQKYKSDKLKKRNFRPHFFGFIRAHEKTISIIIVFFISSLISFSLGVEKGKRFATNKTQPRKIKAQPKKSIPTDKSPAANFEEKEENRLEKKNDAYEYTVQVATFKTEAYAKKEAERLEKQGVKALIVPRGDFVFVCVGKFTQKQEADPTLNQLRKRYQDCFVRRL